MKRPRGTWRRRILIFLFAAILFLLLVRTGLDLWTGRRINVEVARLEQKYGSLDEKTMNLPAVAEGENRARAMRAAASLISGQPAAQASVSRFLAQRGPAAVPPDLRAFVEANRGALKVADEARARRQSNWEADYSNTLNHPPLLDIRTLSNVIHLAARMDLEAGRPDDAARGVASGLALSASLRHEPSLIAQLIRMAVGSQQFGAVQRLVIDSDLSKASLEEMAKWLAENRAPDPIDVGLLSELKHFNAGLARWETGDGLSPWRGPLARIGRPLLRLYRIRYLERLGGLLDVQTGPRPRPAQPDGPERMSLSRQADQMVGMSGLERAVESGETFNSQLGVTELAVALRRFRLDRGQYPDALSRLVPAYVASVPIDPITGKLPVYVRQASGFRLSAEKGKNASPQQALVLEWSVPK